MLFIVYICCLNDNSGVSFVSTAQRKFLYLRPGDGFSISCSDSDWDIQSVNMYREDNLLFSFDESSDPTHETREDSRMSISGNLRSLRFTLTKITYADSGIYYCKYASASGASTGNATLVAVSGKFILMPTFHICNARLQLL